MTIVLDLHESRFKTQHAKGKNYSQQRERGTNTVNISHVSALFSYPSTRATALEETESPAGVGWRSDFQCICDHSPVSPQGISTHTQVCEHWSTLASNCFSPPLLFLLSLFLICFSLPSPFSLSPLLLSLHACVHTRWPHPLPQLHSEALRIKKAFA